MTEQADVIVVGLGPGSEDVAERLAEAGLDVVGIEAELVGGECPYWGCVPSKMMIRAADLLAEARRVPGWPGPRTCGPTGRPWRARIRDEATDDWDDTVAVERFEGKGGRFVRGWGASTARGRVVVGDTALRGEPRRSSSASARARVGAADRRARDDAVLDEPRGDRGDRGARLARGHRRWRDRRRARPGLRALRRARSRSSRPARGSSAPRSPRRASSSTDGVRARGDRVGGAGASIESVRHDGERLHDRRRRARAGRRRAAARRDGAPAATSRARGGHASGVDEDARALPVDDHLRVVGRRRTWAVGDVTGKGAFTHVSMYQADIVVNDVLGHEVVPADYRALPRVTFTDPEIGSVGLTEAEARGRGARGAHRARPDPRVDARMDPQGRQRRVHQARRGRRPRRPRRRDVGGPLGRRGARLLGPRRPRRGADRAAPAHDLRLPHVPPRDRGRASGTSPAAREPLADAPVSSRGARG